MLHDTLTPIKNIIQLFRSLLLHCWQHMRAYLLLGPGEESLAEWVGAEKATRRKLKRGDSSENRPRERENAADTAFSSIALTSYVIVLETKYSSNDSLANR